MRLIRYKIIVAEKPGIVQNGTTQLFADASVIGELSNK
jgi:hypothetical protein